MMNMTRAPSIIPILVPIGPAVGRKVVPGITKDPHPTAHPKERAHTFRGERYLSSFVLFPDEFALSIAAPLILNFSFLL
jgi:hypothetical protein